MLKIKVAFFRETVRSCSGSILCLFVNILHQSNLNKTLKTDTFGRLAVYVHAWRPHIKYIQTCHLLAACSSLEAPFIWSKYSDDSFVLSWYVKNQDLLLWSLTILSSTQTTMHGDAEDEGDMPDLRQQVTTYVRMTRQKDRWLTCGLDGWSRDRQVLETAISGTRGSLLTCHITAKYVCHSAPPQLTCSSAPAILTYISVIQTCVKPSTRADLSSRHEPI